MSEEKEVSRPVSDSSQVDAVEPDGIPGPDSEPEQEIQDPTEHYRAKKGINQKK